MRQLQLQLFSVRLCPAFNFSVSISDSAYLATFSLSVSFSFLVLGCYFLVYSLLLLVLHSLYSVLLSDSVSVYVFSLFCFLFLPSPVSICREDLGVGAAIVLAAILFFSLCICKLGSDQVGDA